MCAPVFKTDMAISVSYPPIWAGRPISGVSISQIFSGCHIGEVWVHGLDTDNIGYIICIVFADIAKVKISAISVSQKKTDMAKSFLSILGLSYLF